MELWSKKVTLDITMMIKMMKKYDRLIWMNMMILRKVMMILMLRKHDRIVLIIMRRVLLVKKSLFVTELLFWAAQSV